ncbi:MAG: hypothetical protein IKA82_04195, partial [Clostridia bacterium]|nr:hypothetical protein [Clostridia bacterium]
MTNLKRIIIIILIAVVIIAGVSVAIVLLKPDGQQPPDPSGGTGAPDSASQSSNDTEPVLSRLDQDSSWIIHADMVPVLKPTSVDFVLVYYLNRTEQNAEVFDAVMKDSSVWLGYQIATNNADTWGGEQKVLFADQKGVDGYYADCFEPQSVVLRSVPLDEFEN